MIQTINPYASSTTAEIMSRYRPIAPKPEPPTTNSVADNENSGVPTGIRKSPYLRNVWAHLQARPTRTRKRGRTAAFSPPAVKRTRTCLQGLSSPYQVITTSPAKNLAMHGFTHAANGLTRFSLVQLKCGLDTAATDSVSLPAICCGGAAAAQHQHPITNKGKEIDLNMTADQCPEELDLLPKLQETVKPSVISPRPIRPIGSNIIVKNISDDPESKTIAKGAEEVEEFAEAEMLPAIVSDSNNKVRIANSAYREMVGQPECGWLECATGKRGAPYKRIGGEVSLQFVHSNLQPCMHGFTGEVKIVWESHGKKICLNTCCSGVKLDCQAKDYQFLWRFHTIQASESA